MTGSTRVVPHAFNEGIARIDIDRIEGEIEEDTQRIFSGELDSNLPLIFNSIAQQTAELACLKYLFADLPVNEVLDLYSKSSQAIANMFRLLGPDGSKVIIEWDGKQRSLPAQTHMDMQNAIRIPFGIKTAIISHRNKELDFLCSLEEEKYTHPSIISNKFALEYVKFLQQLAINNTSGLEERAEFLRDNMAQAYAKKVPDNDFHKAVCSGYLSLLEGSAAKIETRVNELLEKHKRLFDSDRNNMRGSILGLVSIDGMALLILASQRGIKTEIDNPYIPSDLLNAAIHLK